MIDIHLVTDEDEALLLYKKAMPKIAKCTIDSTPEQPEFSHLLYCVENDDVDVVAEYEDDEPIEYIISNHRGHIHWMVVFGDAPDVPKAHRKIAEWCKYKYGDSYGTVENSDIRKAFRDAYGDLMEEGKNNHIRWLG